MVTALSAHYVHVGWVQVSPANLTVIILMLVGFIAAVACRMPSGKKERHDERQ